MDGNGMKRRILIVDDDELNTVALAQRLSRRGFEVVTVFDSTAVIQLLEKENFELVLLDIVMPKKDGLTLLKEIRSKYDIHRLPVIMATVVNDSFDVSDAFKLGASDYITKPINIDAASARIRGQISNRDLFHEQEKRKELEAVQAVVVTCNHEINNPLTIALGEIQSILSMESISDKKSLSRIQSALLRIKDIVQKLKDVAESTEVEFETYDKTSKMVKIQK